MADGNIYQAPAQGPPALPMNQVPAQKPPVIQVFGVLHLLAGGYGIITGLWAFYMTFFGNPFLNMLPPGPARDSQEEMTRVMAPMMHFNLAITSILVVLVTVAGIKLLRGRKNSVKFSNIYAVSSILGKIGTGVLTFIYLIPAQRQMIEQQFSELEGMPSSMRTGMDAVIIGGPIGGILFTCIYPVLALILLNRSSVKAWLESFGK